jgi:hypothetical protein
MTTTPGVTLDAIDAVELAELLEFVHDWLADAPARVAASLRRHGGPGYGIDDLRADLARFAFLLGGDGERLFGDQQ